MIAVDVEGHGRVDAALLPQLEAAAEVALRACGVERAELSVTVLDDDGIRDLNRTHLGHDRPTDVIAFALTREGDDLVVGDVYVGAEQAARQAADEGVALDEELVRLVVHGTLHVTGLDHPEAADERAASEMYRLQERLVAGLMDGRAQVGLADDEVTP